MKLGMPANDLKLFTAITVAIALSTPRIKASSTNIEKQRRRRRRLLKINGITKTFNVGTVNEKTALEMSA